MGKKRRFIVTPRWYSYGGMFESLFLALNLARYYKLKLIFTYPDIRFDDSSRYPGFLNKELKFFVCKDVDIPGDYRSLASGLLTFWINLCRLLGKAVPGKVLARLGLRDKFFPRWIGYFGISTGRQLQVRLRLPQPVDWKGVLSNPVQVELTRQQEERARPILEKLGIPKGKPFVCMYARDSGFERTRNTQNCDISNADVDHYMQAASDLIQKGYYVLRVGDPLMKPVRSQEGIIDYVHTPYYSQLVDLYIYRHCAFWLGSMGGALYAPLFYNRPMIVTNAVQLAYSGCCISKNSVFISKHVFSLEKKRFLSLREQLELMHKMPPFDLRFKEYLFVENAPDEIRQVVAEWFLSNENTGFEWDDGLQDEYHDLRQRRSREVFYNPLKEDWDIPTVEEHYYFRPRVGKKFLRDCWEYGDYLKVLTERYLKGA